MSEDKLTNFVHFFLRKWLIGLVSTTYGRQSPLVLVLTGPPNTGKTQFFRRLLPEELTAYYAETKFDEPKDDAILMCTKLLLMNDEFGGNTVREAKKFKDLTDKHTFSIRRPYGRAHEDLPRLAVLAGTSNDESILNDPTGNRRIIPVNVLKIDYEAYNAIDKVDLLMEAYWAWREGETSDLTNEDIAFLNRLTERFEEISVETELIRKLYCPPKGDADPNAQFMPISDILQELQNHTRQLLAIKTVGQHMKKMGFRADRKKQRGMTVRGYWVIDAKFTPL